MAHQSSSIAPNEVFLANGLPGDMRIGSNSQGPHPASIERPVQHPEWDKPSRGGYVVSNHMINEPPPNKPFRIIVMGAGAAGIDFLHFAPSAFSGLGVEYVCYDKNSDVGGTWYENRYPGCACDVPSVGYTFPWKANPRWTSFYSTSQEIWAYMKEIVEEEGMMQHIQLRTEIKSAIWNEDKSKWIVKLSKSGTDASPTDVREWEEECDFLVNGTGFLKYVLCITQRPGRPRHDIPC